MSSTTHGPAFTTGSREAKLSERMARMRVLEEDITESFTRSSGPGGQNVNKTSSAVVLIHAPTGIQVRCEQERSQAVNRLRARELLLDKIDEQRRAALAAQRAAAEKIRRQKRPRSRAAKERILRDKARNSAKKKTRRFTGGE
jgi:protein subunit release factor B